MAKSWNTDDDAALIGLLDSGVSMTEAAFRMNRSYESLRMRLRKIGGIAPAAIVAPPEDPQAIPVEAFRGAAMGSEALRRIAELEKQLHDAAIGQQQTASSEYRLPVFTNAEPQPDMAEVWRRVAEDSTRRIHQQRESSCFTVDVSQFEADLPIAVAVMSDQHIAPGTPVDHQRMLDDAILVRDTPGLYSCLGGDGVDNHIKHRAAVLAARSQPGDQWQMYDWYLSILAPKLLAVISGNHDLWTNQVAGLDMVLELAKKNRVMYSPDEAFITLQHGGYDYTMIVRHQYRMNSSFNQTHAVKQLYRNGETLFDIGVVCHHHEAAIECFYGHGLQRWAARPGAYQITSAYSRQFGYNKTYPTCPTFILWPRERRILGFPCVRDAVMVLPTIRAQWLQSKVAA